METLASGGLAQWGVRRLREILPPPWEVVERPLPTSDTGAAPDAIIELRAPQQFATLIVEAKAELAPREAGGVLSQLGPFLARFGRADVLVVSRSLSAKTRERLRDQGFNYLDQDGNAYLRLDAPTLFVRLEPPRQPKRANSADSALRLSSTTAARVVRTLIDCRPPLSNKAISAAAATSPGYVTKLVDGLDRELLVTKGARGVVVDIDWASLLRRWAEAADRMRREGERYYVARQGARALADVLADGTAGIGSTLTWRVSGSYAARLLAPVTAPTMLTLVVDDLEAFATTTKLLATDGPQGADVRLVPPYDPIVYVRGVTRGRLPLVALPEIVADCLTGPGRAPAEAEALIRWMNDPSGEFWRAASPSTVAPLDLDKVAKA